MVLAIMVIFLSFRVYQIVRPPEPPKENVASSFLPPGSQLPPDVVTPGTPPRVPPPPSPENWTNLWRRNPFTYPSPRDSRRQGSDSESEIDLQLLNIQQSPDGSYRVLLRSPNGRRGWYSEGDAFEAYQLLKIDPEGPCVEVYSDELERREEICK